MTLLTVDVVGTMGDAIGDPAQLLADVAQRHHPLPSMGDGENPWKRRAAEINRWFLNVAPTLDEDTIGEVSSYLMFPADAWPENQESGFCAYDYTEDALDELGTVGDVVALSNLSILGGPTVVQALNERFGHLIAHVYTSYALGTRKPHRRCWRTIAHERGIPVSDLIHIGDTVAEDIIGAFNAGCRGAILVGAPGQPVPAWLRENPRFVAVNDLRAAASAAAAWAS